ncbi:MAG: class I SAM-dependent methyltransferase [Pseudomonadota bacterium]
MKHSDRDLAWLHTVRDVEWEAIDFPAELGSTTSVLELGSGTGYILDRLRKHFDSVTGLEVSDSSYSPTVTGAKYYDGVNIPCEDGSLDLVVSFHVLEHATQLSELLVDCKRVLKPDGVMIHVLPSPTWRFLTTLLWYFGAVAYVLRRTIGRSEGMSPGRDDRLKNGGWRQKLLPRRHGEKGNAITEGYHFRKKRWIGEFESAGFIVSGVKRSGIIYWGNDFFRSSLSVRSRNLASRVIGSSSLIYMLRKPAAVD